MMTFDRKQFEALFRGSSGRLFLYSLVFLVFNIAFMSTYVCNLGSEKLALTDKALQLRKTLNSSKSDEGKLGARRVVEARDSLGTFIDSLPSETGLTKVLGDINKKAKRNGLGIKTGSYSPSKVSLVDINKYTISFTVSGSYSRIKKFLYDLENLKHFLVIEDVNLSTSAMTKNGIALNINISTFYK